MSLGQKLIEYNKKAVYPFHMPGHKRKLVPMEELESAYSMDITEIEGFDNLHDAQGVIRDAQMRAARVFGADTSFFLVNSTTSGILASVCGLVKEGDYVVMARNCHKSVYNAVMLSGATPVYLYPQKETFFDVNAGISPEMVNQVLVEIEGRKLEEERLEALRQAELKKAAEQAAAENNEKATDSSVAAQNTDATKEEAEKAAADKGKGRVLVIVTSPTYEGIVSDIEGISKVCKKHKAAFLVDAAHGAHFGFSEGFPKSASMLGANIEVISLHKTLPAPTQTALLHIGNEVRTVDYDRIRYFLSVFQSSSPSYILMAGIDACVEYLEQNAATAFKEYEEKLDDFIKFAESLNNISIMTKDKLLRDGSYDFDKSKIVICDKTGRFSGKELYNFLLNTYNLQPEMSSGNYVLLMTSIADDSRGFYRLKEALTLIDKAIDDGKQLAGTRNLFIRLYDKVVAYRLRKVIIDNVIKEEAFVLPENEKPVKVQSAANPREVLFSNEKRWVKIPKSVGKVSASQVMIYPPGIPVIMPGEKISKAAAQKIMDSLGQELTVIGLKDNKEIEVLWEK